MWIEEVGHGLGKGVADGLGVFYLALDALRILFDTPRLQEVFPDLFDVSLELVALLSLVEIQLHSIQQIQFGENSVVLSAHVLILL